jgi:hypothetical protein
MQTLITSTIPPPTNGGLPQDPSVHPTTGVEHRTVDSPAQIDLLGVTSATQRSEEPISRDAKDASTVKARYGVTIQTLKNHSPGIAAGVYLTTFQKGRGQHMTTLETTQARTLGERLIALADEIERGFPAERVEST